MTYVWKGIARFARVSLVPLALASCGGIVEEAELDLDLPAKSFTIDAASWQVNDDQAELLLDTSCGRAPTVCSAAAAKACAMDCTASCNAATDRCELALDVSLYQSIDLVMEKPELASLPDEPGLKVTVDAITYEITANTLNVATPELSVYVAPRSVMDPRESDAKLVGTIAAVAAGTTTPNPVPMTFTATGKADLAAAMKSYKTPFNVLVGSTITIAGDQPLPTGRLDAVVSIRAHAGL